jgi:hypothetical protein
LRRSVHTAIPAAEILAVAKVAPATRNRWSSILLEAIQCFGDTEHPGLGFVFEVLRAWKALLADQHLPPDVEAFLRTHVAETPASHFSAQQAQELLAR